MATALTPPQSLGELHERVASLGDIPPHRIRLQPWPGDATEDDLLAVTGVRCELIDGILVEKAMGSPQICSPNSIDRVEPWRSVHPSTAACSRSRPPLQ
jgi:hypothetical protein